MDGRLRNPRRQLTANLCWGFGCGAVLRCSGHTSTDFGNDPHQPSQGTEEGVSFQDKVVECAEILHFLNTPHYLCVKKAILLRIGVFLKGVCAENSHF